MRLGRLVAVVATLACSITPLSVRATHPIADCEDTRPSNWRPARGVADGAGDVRVFAVQYKQEIRYAETYGTYRRKMRCLVEQYVAPNLSHTEPNIVVLNEDIGLATLGLGTRGAAARAIAAGPVKDPMTLAGAIGGFASVGAAYAPQIAYYAAREPETGPQRLILAAATDTFVRAFMQTFSDIARDYGVYVVASNNQAEFREINVDAHPKARILIDPDLLPRYLDGSLRTVYEALDSAGPRGGDDDVSLDDEAGSGLAGINVHNKAFMWSPNPGVEPYADARFGAFALDGAHLSAADPRSNLIAVSKKTPVTQIEKDLLDITDDGDLSTENVGPFPLEQSPLPDAIKIGFGISLPAFMWGSAFGQPASCASRLTWMRCLDEAGVSLFLQPEANPGPWASYNDGSFSPPIAFQALSWQNSAWRAVADPTVSNIRYSLTPFMVGNLVDLPFDGQSSIFERCFLGEDPTNHCIDNTAANHVGTRTFIECPKPFDHCDAPSLMPYAGLKDESIVIADWVLADDLGLDAWTNRERLAERSKEMLAGSGSDFENGYLETAVWADLDFD